MSSNTYCLPTTECIKSMKMLLSVFLLPEKEPQNFSDPLGHYCSSNWRNNWNPTATILLILTLSPALSFIVPTCR